MKSRPRMTAMKPEKQRVDGILLVNKPKDLTSNAVLQTVKRLYNAKKAGHTGSLDPLATGMLPICFGEATKFCQYLLDADKCYEVTGLLGVKTNTGDSTGVAIAEVSDFTVTLSELQDVLLQFQGNIMQVPSMFSALKHQGKPLYKFARAGIDIERPARPVTIHQIILNDFDGQSFSLTVSCSKGTYIRNLVEDIGETLGVGAHVTRLHRTYTLGFSEDTMYSLPTLQDSSNVELTSYLLPPDRAVAFFPRIDVSLDQAQALRQGKIINDFPLVNTVGCVRLYENTQHFMGLGELHDSGDLTAKRLLMHYNTQDLDDGSHGDLSMSTSKTETFLD